MGRGFGIVNVNLKYKVALMTIGVTVADSY